MGVLAGELRHRVVIQKITNGGFNNHGFEIDAGWIDFKTLWAKVTPVSAKDLISSQAEQSEVVARLKIRYRTDIDTTMRIVWKNRIFAIHSQALDDNVTGNQYCTFLLSGGMEQFKE